MTPAFAADDFRHMAQALRLAARGACSTRPNPRVGCVLARDGEVVGAGWHARAGGPHAEIEALRAAGERARGATCYVNLEPCCHHGRTPPCTNALIAAGVTRVVAALPDPNPLVAGGGLRQLAAAGVAVQSDLMRAEAETLNRGFLLRMRSGRPHVRAKVGMSLDGRVAAANGDSRWITSATARHDVQRLRAESCAVLTGIGTVLADDPRFTVRDPDCLELLVAQPHCVVLDSRLRIPATARLLATPERVLLFVAEEAESRVDALRRSGVEVAVVSRHDGGLDLEAVLAELGRRAFNDVLLEAGPALTGAMLTAGLVDELICYLAPSLLGTAGLGMAVLPHSGLADAVGLEIADVRAIGPDLRITARPRRA